MKALIEVVAAGVAAGVAVAVLLRKQRIKIKAFCCCCCCYYFFVLICKQ